MFSLGFLLILLSGGIATAIILNKIRDNSKRISEINSMEEKRLNNALSSIEKDLKNQAQCIKDENIQYTHSLEEIINNNFQKLIGDYLKERNQWEDNILLKNFKTITDNLETIKQTTQNDRQEIEELLRVKVDFIIDYLKELIKETGKNQEDQSNFVILANKYQNALLDLSKNSHENALAMQAKLKEIQDNFFSTTEFNNHFEKERKNIHDSPNKIMNIEEKLSEIEKNLQNFSSAIAGISDRERKETQQTMDNSVSENEENNDVSNQSITLYPERASEIFPLVVLKREEQDSIELIMDEESRHLGREEPPCENDPILEEGDLIEGKMVRQDPRKSGGRRLGSNGNPADVENRIEFPKMYCIRRAGLWEVFLKIQKRTLKQISRKQAEIEINNEPVCLPPHNGKCAVTTLKTDCAVRVENQPLASKSFGDGEYLLFKLLKRGIYKYMEKYSKGTYICIVPEDYARDRDRCCEEEITTEKVLISGYLVHFFSPTPGKGISFHRPNGTILRIPTYFQKFSLEGNRIPFTDNRNFFIGELPKIASSSPRSWEEVSNIELRQESAEVKRKKEFIPIKGDETRKRIVFPEDMQTRGGHFTVLLYDRWNKLIESYPFYFHKDISSVEALDYDPYTEDEDEGDDISMNISHAPDLKIQPLDDETSANVEYETDGKNTSIIFPRDPEKQRFKWKVEQEGSETILFTFCFPGFYWSIRDRQTPGTWTRKDVEVNLKDLKASAERVLYIRVPEDADNFRMFFKYSRTEKINRKKMEYNSGTGFWEMDLSQLGQKIVAERQSYLHRKIPLFVSFRNSKGYQEKRIGSFLERQVCKYCGEKIPVYQLKEHCKDNHKEELLKDNFREPTYDELKAVDKTLPEHIYKCPYCPFYSQTGGNKNATDDIYEHIEIVHHGRKISFTVVSDMTEIREKVLTDLCETWRCKICGKDFTDKKDMWQHLLREHPDAFVAEIEEIPT